MSSLPIGTDSVQVARSASRTRGPAADGATIGLPTSLLLERLAEALDAEAVACCQWKGHGSSHRWATGEGDVDLLVDHQAIPVFRRVVTGLGFKLALLPGERELPGVESYFGYDPALERLVHLHVHYRLVLGDYWRTTYRLPIEGAILETSVPGNLFRVPSPEYQFLIFIIRMVLRQRGILPAARSFPGIRIQVDNLEALCSRDALVTLLGANLPTIDLPFLERCAALLRGTDRLTERALLCHLLHRRLRAHSRRPPLIAILGAAAEKIAPAALRRRISGAGMRSSGGGTVIALVGGDGAGKTTCARELETWLSTGLATVRAQMGNPPRSFLTFAVGGLLKVERALNRMLRRESLTATQLELVRYLCTARDRHCLYEKVERFAARGGVAVCERYPISEITSHVGPCIPALQSASPTAFRKHLQNAEGRYYERMRRPDLLFVLRLDPELAVARKPEEPADYVRARGRAIWEADWTATEAQLVDAGRSLPEVLDDLKARIWRSL